MAKTDIHEWPLPEITAQANVPADMLALAAAMDKQVPFVCTSSTRPAPTAGFMIYETNTKRWYYGDGTDWHILAQDWVNFTPRFIGWKALGTNPTQRGQYCIGPGGMVTVRLQLKGGAGSSMGTGRVSVDGFPVAVGGSLQQYGECTWLISGPNGILRPGIMTTGGGATGAEFYIAQGSAPVATPGAAGIPWQANSELHCSMTYNSVLGKLAW